MSVPSAKSRNTKSRSHCRRRRHCAATPPPVAPIVAAPSPAAPLADSAAAVPPHLHLRPLPSRRLLWPRQPSSCRPCPRLFRRLPLPNRSRTSCQRRPPLRLSLPRPSPMPLPSWTRRASCHRPRRRFPSCRCRLLGQSLRSRRSSSRSPRLPKPYPAATRLDAVAARLRLRRYGMVG
jgi:hypothetical protein